MATVFVRDLRFRTIIGCWDWERQAPQEVSIDLEMEWDIASAAVADDLSAALNYKDVSQRVVEFVQQGQFQLVETAVTQLADMIIAEFSVPHVSITFSKPHAVSGAAAVGVMLEKSAPE